MTAVAVGDFDDPPARARAAAIAERDPGAYGGEVVGLAAHRQLEAGGAGFEAGSTRAEYAAEIDSEERKWSALVKSLNLNMQ